MDIWTNLVMFILSVDTLRAVIAMTGIVKRSWKYSWIIYGQHDNDIVSEAFKSLGFNETQTKSTIEEMKSLAKGVGITKDNAAMRLISLISQNIMKFDNPITYGGQRMTNSKYYVNTMEASQNTKMLKEMAIMMYFLIEKHDVNKPDFILTPKGGNPILAQEVANLMGCHLVIVKEDKDKSKVQIKTQEYTQEILRVNYEGANSIINQRGQAPLKGILVDCNTSGGTQLLSIAEDFGEIIQVCGLNIERPTAAYVLFRVDTNNIDIDQKFKDCGCVLHRYFDLDEAVKERIYGNGEGLSYYKDNQTINNIIFMMKNKNHYYF